MKMPKMPPKKCIKAWLLASGFVLMPVVFLFPFYSPPLLNFLDGNTTRIGIVLDVETGAPIAGAKISGGYQCREVFAPTFDGFYSKKQIYFSVFSDQEGKFKIVYKGPGCTINVKVSGYDLMVTTGLWELPEGKIIVKLKPYPRSPDASNSLDPQQAALKYAREHLKEIEEYEKRLAKQNKEVTHPTPKSKARLKYTREQWEKQQKRKEERAKNLNQTLTPY